MKIIRAEHLGMCFGVRDAIHMVHREAASVPVTVPGSLVHNEQVNAALAARGVRIESNLADVKTDNVIITAHGASEGRVQYASTRGFNVLEAMCPLVRYAHQSLSQLVAEGYHPVIIGQRGHVEVNGLVGDLAEYDIVLDEQDVLKLQERLRFGIVSQTTQPHDRVNRLIKMMQSQFPTAEIRSVDTVCLPTKQRQQSAITLAKQADIVVVIGGVHSNNTRELAETCSRFCKRVFKIQNADDLELSWFQGAQTVGITAGTSTPDTIVDQVEQWLQHLEEL